MAPKKAETRASKRARADTEPAGTSAGSNVEDAATALMVVEPPAVVVEEDDTTSYLPREFERLFLSVNPTFIERSRSINCVGYERAPIRRVPILRYYTLSHVHLRTVFTNVFSSYLTDRLFTQGLLTAGEITAEVERIAPLVANACIAAVYAKLRMIHRQFQTFAGRYQAPPSYNKTIELPTPFADAIENIGVFTPVSIEPHYVCVPTFAEGTQNEGRATQHWDSCEYEAYVPYLKSLGIGVKSVDVNKREGSPWWTLKFDWFHNHFNLRCIYPPINYSDHAAATAAMFALVPAGDAEPSQCCQAVNGDINYAIRLREMGTGSQLAVFTAMDQAPIEEWNQYMFIK